MFPKARRGNTWIRESAWMAGIVSSIFFIAVCGLMLGVNVTSQKPSQCTFGFPFQKDICFPSDIQKVPSFQPLCRPSTPFLVNITTHHYPCNYTTTICYPSSCDTINQAFRDYRLYNLILGIFISIFSIILIASIIGYVRHMHLQRQHLGF